MTKDDPATPEAKQVPRSSRTLRAVLAGVLGLALIGSVGWLGYEVYERTTTESTVQSNRDAAMLRSREYVLAAATVGPADLDENGKLTDYRESVMPLISTARKPVFEQGLGPLADDIAVNGYRSTTKVNRLGVESISEDKATVLVDLEQTLSNKDEQLGTLALRWRIKLVHVDGEWLVDSVTEVVGGAR